jgi:hypothetical protein
MSSFGCFAPRQPDDKRHKPNQTEVFGRQPLIVAPDTKELLIAVVITDRRDEDPARGKAVNEGRWDLRRRGGDDYAVVGRLFRPTLCPITESANDVAQAQFGESTLGIAH